MQDVIADQKESMNASEQIKKFHSFLEEYYYPKILENLRKDNKFVVVDFAELSKFDIDLASHLLEDPEEAIKAAELATAQFDVENIQNFRVRFTNLPQSQNIMVRNIRSKHIGKLVYASGIVRQKSDVRPQVTAAKFECPVCGNVINVLQLDGNFKEPSKCGCGRKGKFTLLSKELVDAQGIVLEESPESLEGGEQPKRINILLKDDLVSPLSEKKTNPGSKITVVGIIKEVPIILKTGSKSTRFDLMIESNYIGSIEESLYEIEITPEEEQTIVELSKDPNLFSKLVNSAAPSIYGYEKVKESLLLQLVGGVRKVRSDKVVSRGDMHILLVGDPGCIAGDSQVALAYKGMEKIQRLGQRHLQPIKEVVTKIRKHALDKDYDFATVFQHYPKQPVLKVVTETGKEVVCTYNQPFLTKEGWKRSDEIILNESIRVMPKIPCKVKNLADTCFVEVKKTFGKLKEISIPDKVTEELASLYGYIIGDGNLHPNGYRVACYVNNEEKDLIGAIAEFWKRTFNVEPAIITKDERKIKTIDDGSGLLRQFISLQPMHILEVNSRQVASSLSFLSNKRVPQQIFRSPKQVIAKFISWLFEADGCAFGKGRGRTSIQLKSRTIGLLKDVQLLLLYFGIHSRIVEDNLCIRRSYDIELFAQNIGFNSEKKKKAMNKVLEVVKARSDVQKRKKMQRWERVIEILPAGIQDVYDFEVPVSHSFIANGIVCHNSGKSVMLKRISTISPKGRYVSGKGVSGAGLTASVVRDEFLKGWSLEAGALVLASDGICCIDEMDKMSPEDRAAMHEALEQQCLHHDSIITLANGEEQVIGKFVDELMDRYNDKIIEGKDCLILPTENLNIEMLTTDWEHIRKTKINRVSKHIAADHFIKITLGNGRSITVTPEHPFFCVENGKIITKRADEVSSKDWVPVPLKIPIEGVKQFFKIDKNQIYNRRSSQHIIVPQSNCEEFFKIVGYLVSEGSKELNRGKLIGINFTNKYPILLQDFSNSMKSLFGLMPYKQARIDEHDIRWMLRYTSRELASFFEKVCPTLLEKANRKELPQVVMRAESANVSKMLRCMFEGDDHVSKKLRTIRIGYGTNSKRLAEQVQDLLLRFSIRSNLTEYKETYKVSITGYENIFRFKEHIGFTNNSKNKIIEDYLIEKAPIRTVKDVVPNISEAVVSLLEKYKVKSIGNYSSYDIKWNHTKRGFNFSRKFLQKIVHCLKNKVAEEDENIFDNLRKFAYGEIGFEKVRRVERIQNNDQKWAYDVTIEPNHTFISQNMVLHNTVSISKANIQATLISRTTVLAAANPKFGRFDPYGIIAEQIDLPPTLINRFDLIFTIKDIPDESKDEKMATHILKLHQKPDLYEPELPTEFLRKYVAYAKQKITPRITDGALEEIKSFYLKMRSSGSTEGGIKAIPISARQLEALVRLTEASAKLRLSQEATEEDARRAIQLVEYCLMQVGLDRETGKIDIDRIATGISASQRSHIIVVKDIIADLESKVGKIIPIDDVMEEAKNRGVSEDKAEEVLEKLKRVGEVFEPRRGFLSKI